MRLFRCRTCEAKDEATRQLRETHAREVDFLRGQVGSLQKQVLALADRGALAAVQPRPPVNPENAARIPQHSPGMIRRTRSDRPSEEEIRAMERIRELGRQLPDAGQPEPGPSREQIESSFKVG